MVIALKKGDIVIIISVVLAFAISVAALIPFSKQGNRVVIKQNNKIIYNENLSVNKTINTKTNTIIINNGVVYMDHSSCKNQLCINMGKISKTGESIVCLPNKVIVEIE